MLYRYTVLTFAFAMFLFAPSTARGDDVEDLKAAGEQMVKAYNLHDTDALVALVHDNIVVLGPWRAVHKGYRVSSFPSPFDSARGDKLSGKAEYKKALEGFFAKIEEATLKPLDTQCRITGSTGVCWGEYLSRVKAKGRSFIGAATGSGRSTWTKSGGKWLLVKQIFSPLRSPTFAAGR